MHAVFFDGWLSLARIAIVAAGVYILIVAALRLLGAEALAKMSAYDLIVTVALGSLVAAIPLAKDITITDGFVAGSTFLLLQDITRRLQKRFPFVHHAVRQRPHVVVWDGELLQDRLGDIHITDDEVRSAIRRAGFVSLSQVQAVVLENDGDWSVLPRSDARDLSALDGLVLPYTLEPGESPAHWRNRHDVRRGPRPEAEGADGAGDGRKAQTADHLHQ